MWSGIIIKPAVDIARGTLKLSMFILYVRGIVLCRLTDDLYDQVETGRDQLIDLTDSHQQDRKPLLVEV